MSPSNAFPPAPRVISPLSPDLRDALIALLSCSLLSVLCTFCLLVWLTYRLIFWRRYYTRYPGYNQCILLIYNLLLADLQQSSSFLITPYWLQQDKLTAYSPACFIQAWLINFGDVSSGLFVLAIAVHTFAVVIKRKHIGHRTFVGCIIGLWMFCSLITLIAPATHGKYVFVPAGAWCWIDTQYEAERLYLHYIWIFIAEFGIIILYSALFVVLRRRIHVSGQLGGTADRGAQKFNKVIQVMLLYPFAYIIVSLPIAAGRMSLMNGHDPGSTYFYATGALIMCSGWIDSILYFVTRRRLVEADIQTESDGNTSQRRRTGYGNVTSSTGPGAESHALSAIKQNHLAPGKERNRLSGSSSTDHIMEPAEFTDLGGVNQTTVIEISTESKEDKPSSNVPSTDPTISSTSFGNRSESQRQRQQYNTNTATGPMKYLKFWDK